MRRKKGRAVPAVCLALVLAMNSGVTLTAAELPEESAAASGESAAEGEETGEGESQGSGEASGEGENQEGSDGTSGEGESQEESGEETGEGESQGSDGTSGEGESQEESGEASGEGESQESQEESGEASGEGESQESQEESGEVSGEGESQEGSDGEASEDGLTAPVMPPDETEKPALPKDTGLGIYVDLSVYENGPKEPLPPPEGEPAAAAFSEEPEYPVQARTVSGAKLGEPNKEIAASIEDFEISLEGKVSTVFASANRTISASIPAVTSFFDYQGNYNVVYQDATNSALLIQRYNARMNLVDTLRIGKRYPLFGAIVADGNGYYYVVWGKNDQYNENSVTMCVSKYDYKGGFVADCTLKGFDMDSYSSQEWGTAQPFRSGNCSVVLNNGILACNFSRQMYNGHQSNYVFFVDCGNMQRTRTTSKVPYVSHSFDQRIIGVSGTGGDDYLVANQGDAFARSFRVSLIKSQGEGVVYDIDNFHFREGADRAYGYNETYAQMGGIGETKNAYVFCGSSERTLSRAPAPTGGEYYGHSEARDLFIQFLKKDFYNYQGMDQYVTRENPRYITGTRPGSSKTDLYLKGNETDYGVIWLTEYEDDYYVNNPKMVVTDDNRVVVMWEKLSYATHTGASYYAILDEQGKVYQDTLEMIGVRLAGNIDPVYRNGKIYWTTSDETGAHIYSLDISKTEKIDPYEGLRKVGDKWIFVRRGRKDSSVNGLVPFEGQWFYLRNGEVDTSVRGFVNYDGRKFYVAEGRVCSEYSGLVQDPASGKWYFVSEGQFQDQYSGLALYDGSWFLLSSGVLDDSYNGLYHYDGRDFLMANGQIRTDYSGLFQYGESWYFLTGGQVSDYTGLTLYDGKWFYIRSGILASYYTGNVTYDGQTFYVSNGQIY